MKYTRVCHAQVGMGEPETEDDKITCIVGRDRWTTVTSAHVVEGEGVMDDWIVQQLYDDINPWGIQRPD